jgi:hypothetical protein
MMLPARSLETSWVPHGTPTADPPGWAPLGGLLLAQGLITAEELADALAAQQKSGKRLGEILVESGLVSKLALARALALQYGITLEEETGYGNGLRGELERRKQPNEAGAVVAADEFTPPGRPEQKTLPTTVPSDDHPLPLAESYEPPLEAFWQRSVPPSVASGNDPLGIAQSSDATPVETFWQPADGQNDLGVKREELELRERRVSDLRDTVADTDALLAELEHQAGAIGGLETDLECAEGLLERLGEQQALFLGLQERANELEQALTQASARLQSEQEQSDELEQRREHRRTLLARLSEHEQCVGELEADLLDYEGLVATQAQRHAATRQTLAERDERLAALTGALEDSANALLEAEEAVKTGELVRERFGEQGAVLSDLQPRVDQLEQALAQAGEGLEGDQARLNELAQRREGQQTRFAEQETRLNGLESELLEHERHTAAQVKALSSLGRTLTERDERIGSVADALEHGTNRLAGLEKAVEAGELSLARLGEQQEALAGVEASADALERALMQGNLRLAELEGELTKQWDLFAEATDLLGELEKRRNQQLRDCHLLDETLNERQSRLSRLQQQVAEHDAAPAQVEAQTEQLDSPTLQDQSKTGCYASVDLRECQIDYGVARLFPESAARSYEALPISCQQGVVIVAIAAPTESRIRAIRHMTQGATGFVNVDRTLLLEAIDTAYAGQSRSAPARRPDGGTIATAASAGDRNLAGR